MTKTYNMTFTDAQLDLIYDALNEYQFENEECLEIMTVINEQLFADNA